MFSGRWRQWRPTTKFRDARAGGRNPHSDKNKSLPLARASHGLARSRNAGPNAGAKLAQRFLFSGGAQIR